MTDLSIEIVSCYLSKQAKILARACAPEDREAAVAFAEVLKRRPHEVLALNAPRRAERVPVPA